MKTIKKHLLSTKSFGEIEKNSLRRPVYKTSAIFPVIHNKSLKTKILFMGYWMVKRGLTLLGFLTSVRDENGVLIHREKSEINSPKAREILIEDILKSLGKENEDFIGSIELEVFSNIDLVFPYPAFVLNYYNEFSSSLVHTTGRIYNDFEDLKENEQEIVKEAGFDIIPGDKYSPFFSFVNGFMDSLDTNIDLEIITTNGLVHKETINIGQINPLQTVFVKIKDYIPLDDFLKGETGTIKIKHQLTGFFPRFIAGNFCTDNGSVSITHTYYDNSENKDVDHYHENKSPDLLLDSAMFFPVFLDDNYYTKLKFYPIYSPSKYSVNLEFYDFEGKLLSEAKNQIKVNKDESSFISIDIKECAERIGIDKSKVKGVRATKEWTNKTKIPSRLKFGLNIGKENLKYDLPTNICFNSETSNVKLLKKNTSFKWMPIVNNHESVITILNSSFVRDYKQLANVTIDIYNTYSSENITREYCLSPHGQIRITLDKELQEFLGNNSGWVTCKSDNPFVTGWYFDFNESGIMGGDHSF